MLLGKAQDGWGGGGAGCQWEGRGVDSGSRWWDRTGWESTGGSGLGYWEVAEQPRWQLDKGWVGMGWDEMRCHGLGWHGMAWNDMG